MDRFLTRIEEIDQQLEEAQERLQLRKPGLALEHLMAKGLVTAVVLLDRIATLCPISNRMSAWPPQQPYPLTSGSQG